MRERLSGICVRVHFGGGRREPGPTPSPRLQFKAIWFVLPCWLGWLRGATARTRMAPGTDSREAQDRAHCCCFRSGRRLSSAKHRSLPNDEKALPRWQDRTAIFPAGSPFCSPCRFSLSRHELPVTNESVNLEKHGTTYLLTWYIRFSLSYCNSLTCITDPSAVVGGYHRRASVCLSPLASLHRNSQRGVETKGMEERCLLGPDKCP
jgi:hypothetical protein